jgi:hypothetical protein
VARAGAREQPARGAGQHGARRPARHVDESEKPKRDLARWTERFPERMAAEEQVRQEHDQRENEERDFALESPPFDAKGEDEESRGGEREDGGGTDERERDAEREAREKRGARIGSFVECGFRVVGFG